MGISWRKLQECQAAGSGCSPRLVVSAIGIMVAGGAPETLNAHGGTVRRNQHTVGNADPCEVRTKQACQSAVRLGAGLGNEVMQTKAN